MLGKHRVKGGPLKQKVEHGRAGPPREWSKGRAKGQPFRSQCEKGIWSLGRPFPEDQGPQPWPGPVLCAHESRVVNLVHNYLDHDPGSC